jgi:hypothetical protein
MNTTEANPKLSAVVRFINRILEFVFGYVTTYERGTTHNERRCNVHWQNLCEDPKGNARGFPWRGRAWLYWHKKERINRPTTFRWEWVFPDFACRAKFELDGCESGINWSFAFPPLSLYFGLEGVLSHDWMYKNFKYEDREIYVAIHDWTIWWSFWRDGNGWSSKESKWRVGSFHIDNLFLGKMTYKRQVLSEHNVMIPMPEGQYPATIKLCEDSWSRPRWFTKRVRRADVNLQIPIPFPGKGENSWDCGDDAIHGMTTGARNVEDAIAAVVKSVLKSRRRHGRIDMTYPSPRQTA